MEPSHQCPDPQLIKYDQLASSRVILIPHNVDTTPTSSNLAPSSPCPKLGLCSAVLQLRSGLGMLLGNALLGNFQRTELTYDTVKLTEDCSLHTSQYGGLFWVGMRGLRGDPNCAHLKAKSLRVEIEDGKLDERLQHTYWNVIVSYFKAKKFPSALVSLEYLVKAGRKSRPLISELGRTQGCLVEAGKLKSQRYQKLLMLQSGLSF